MEDKGKAKNIWCFFRNENCSKQGEFSHPLIAHSKKVFYSFSTKRGKAHTETLRNKIKKILEKRDYELVTYEGVPIPSSTYYCDTICRLIHESAFLIADISFLCSPDEIVYNANIMIEIGLAAGCGKPIILVTDQATRPNIAHELPSNLAGITVVKYDDDFIEKDEKQSEFEKDVVRLINDLLVIPSFEVLRTIEQCNEHLIKLERLMSNRYFLGRHPLSIMRGPKMGVEGAKKLYGDDINHGKYIDEIEERRKGLENLLNKGHRCCEIYVKEKFLEYCRTGRVRTHKNPREEVEARIETLKKSLFAKSNYEIGLLDIRDFLPEGRVLEDLKNLDAPRYFLAKEDYCVYIFSQNREFRKFAGEIIASQNQIVTKHIEFHQQLWDSIKEEDKDKKEIARLMDEAFKNWED